MVFGRALDDNVNIIGSVVHFTCLCMHLRLRVHKGAHRSKRQATKLLTNRRVRIEGGGHQGDKSKFPSDRELVG